MMPSAENMPPRAFPRGKGQHTIHIHIPHTTVRLITRHKTTPRIPQHTAPQNWLLTSVIAAVRIIIILPFTMSTAKAVAAPVFSATSA